VTTRKMWAPKGWENLRRAAKTNQRPEDAYRIVPLFTYPPTDTGATP
jgi:hypothetical protein